MKKKFNQSILFNWPSFVLFVMLCVAFIVTTALVSCKDFSYGEYYYEQEQEEVEYQFIVDLQEGEKCEIIQAYISDLSIKIMKKEYSYIVYDDKLYITESTESDEVREYKYFGKIDGVRLYNIKIDGDTVDLTNESGLALKITCIALFVIFGVCALVNLLGILITKKEESKLEEPKNDAPTEKTVS